MSRIDAAILLFALVSVGCSSENVAPTKADLVPGPANVVTIQTQEGAFASNTPAVFFAAPTLREFRVQGSDGKDVWTAVGQPGDQVVQTGAESLGVTTGPIATGKAAVSEEGASGAVRASNGTLVFHIAKGSVSGALTGAAPAQLNATFQGKLSVQCWVPAADTVGGVDQKNGLISTDGTPVLVLDEALESDACSQFKIWLP